MMKVGMKNGRKGDGGFVSLFTCIIISLLLLVVTMSLVTLETLQLRKAEDAEQTLRAYYTAEAGVEDAVAKVLTKAVTSDQPCVTKTPIYDSTGDANWTCQQITFSGTPFGKLDQPDVAKTVDPGPSSYKSVVVQWNQSTVTNAAFYNMPAALPDQNSGALNYAAPVELSIVEYPTTTFPSSAVCVNGLPAGCSVKLENALIVPGGGAGAVINYGAGLANNGPYRGNCGTLPHAVGGGAGTGTSINYNCYAILTGFNSGKAYIFRIRSKYTASAFQMVFKANPNGNGGVVSVPEGAATIDVTAKAGQTYRRVISKLPLNNGAAGGLNYVMYSDTDICKNFDVLAGVAGSGCPYPP
jgi:Tfp pilus assembly protein PilX